MLSLFGGHNTYLWVNVLCILFPFLLSFQRIMPFYKNWKALLAGTFGMMLLFIPWDAFFTSRGIWGFNPTYFLGPKLLGLPLEEWAFFVCIPYACVFWYECTRFFFPNNPWRKVSPALSVFYMAAAVALALVFWGHWYTMSATLLCAALLGLHQFVWKSNYLGWFHFAWIVLLIPFFISNGVLTGLEFWHYPLINLAPETVSDQVVWYNNAHNLGIRIWSVPLDDFFYGMLMLLLVVTVYERTLKRSEQL